MMAVMMHECIVRNMQYHLGGIGNTIKGRILSTVTCVDHDYPFVVDLVGV